MAGVLYCEPGHPFPKLKQNRLTGDGTISRNPYLNCGYPWNPESPLYPICFYQSEGIDKNTHDTIFLINPKEVSMIFRGLTVILFRFFKIAGIPFFAYAQESSKELETFTVEEIVISATRTETPYREIANSVTVIGADDIENSQQPLLLDLLRSVPDFRCRTGRRTGRTNIGIYARSEIPKPYALYLSMV